MPVEHGKLTVKRKAPEPPKPEHKPQRRAPAPAGKRAESDPHKSPPHSVDAEKGVLSSALQDARNVVPEISRELYPACFYVPAHNTIFQVLLGMFKDDQPIDLLTVTQTLRDRKLLDAVGGAVFVTELFTFVPTSANVRYYIDIVKEKFLLREMIYTGTEMVRRAYVAEDDAVPGLIERAATSIERIKRAAGGPNGSERFDFDQLMAFDSGHDPNTLVGNRYLVRGASSLWCAGSGYGKSTLAIQLAVYWACGQRCFGLRPVRPLKSLIIEAENDRGDMAEQLQGVIMGVSKLGEIDVQQCNEKIRANIGIHRAIGKTGFEFLGLLDSLIEIDKPDFVWIDPLFAFSGCDLLNPEKTGNFLRNGLFPLASKRNVALNVIHHIGKPVRDPAKDDHSSMAEIDYQYLGFGTSEIQNSFRAVNILLPVGNSGVFKLVFSKRGERAGSADDAGNWTRSVFLQHSKEGLCWIEAEKPEKRAVPGAIKYTVEDILNEMSATLGKSTEEHVEHMKKECGMSPRTFYRLWKDLKKDVKIRVDSDGKWYRKAGSLP